MIESGRMAVTRTGAGLSRASDAAAAGREAARQAADAVDGDVDLAFLFLSAAHLDDAEAAVACVLRELQPRHLVGCVAEGVVGGGHEIEEGPGAAVWAASLPPGADVTVFHSLALPSENGAAVVTGVPPLEDPDLVVLLVDPYSFPAASFLAKLNEEQPGLPLVGGLAGGAGRPGEGALIVEDRVVTDGAVGVAVSGAPVVTVVSQGCAPIGRDAVITSAEDNVVYELAGRPALMRLQSEIAGLTPQQRALATRGVLAGLVIDENRSEYTRGDYLMRALLGGDDESGALAVGETVRVGQTLRFHVRDAATADDDLRSALQAALPGRRAAGALLFTCNGRGMQLFDEPDHDAAVVAEALGSESLAGFFAAGEIGPVGSRAFVHGYTATLAVFLDSE